jgi:hypothetical protein
MPNLVGEISDKAKSQVEKLLESGAELNNITKQIIADTEKVIEARKAFYEAEATLPQGDPGVKAALDNWISLQNSPERKALFAKLDDLNGAVNLIPSSADGAAASSAAEASSTGENGITGLIKSASSIGSDLLSTTGVGGILSTAGKVADLTNKVTSALSTPNLTNLASTALSSVKGQGASAVKALIDAPSVAPSTQAINNSISGIIGSIPPVNGTGSG